MISEEKFANTEKDRQHKEYELKTEETISRLKNIISGYKMKEGEVTGANEELEGSLSKTQQENQSLEHQLKRSLSQLQIKTDENHNFKESLCNLQASTNL